jgi:outer membrane protein assembly factor BamB
VTDPEIQHPNRPSHRPANKKVRWWPAIILLLLSTAVLLGIQSQDQLPFQKRNLQSLAALLVSLACLALWWLLFSRTSLKLRFGVIGLAVTLTLLTTATFRIRGVTGDLIPILEFRWKSNPGAPTQASRENATPPTPTDSYEDVVQTAQTDSPQFLGPNRNATLQHIQINPDWTGNPPQILWKHPIGTGWSGFSIVGKIAITQEQRGPMECVSAYNASTGELLWSHGDETQYNTVIAGEGPRATPTIDNNHTYTLGATGLLNCLKTATGELVWQHDITKDAQCSVPEWGFSGSPLLHQNLVIVIAGGNQGRSILAYNAQTGDLTWSGGDAGASYSSPFLTTIASQQQIIAFNSRQIVAHDADNGSVLWTYPWGKGFPHVSIPVQFQTNQLLFSSGYGVGAELLQINPPSNQTNSWQAERIWKSGRMKAKFSNLVSKDDHAYGLDDGILACINLKDGSQAWKEGRYGHGQGLLIGDNYLLMAEDGRLLLLKPTPESPNLLHELPVFDSKTWNPIALARDLLLVRNDLEAAAVRIPVLPMPKTSQ